MPYMIAVSLEMSDEPYKNVVSAIDGSPSSKTAVASLPYCEVAHPAPSNNKNNKRKYFVCIIFTFLKVIQIYQH